MTRFKCWYCQHEAESGRTEEPPKWLKLEQLELRLEGTDHVDYACPVCGRVVICSESEIKIVPKD